jgi:hypothetical protein
VTAGDESSLDLLEEMRAALDELQQLLGGRTVDIELARLRVSGDPSLFRRAFGHLIRSAVAHSQPSASITVRVARTGKAVRIEVVDDDGDPARAESPASPLLAEELRAMGGDLGGGGLGNAACWMTWPLAPGASHAADA